LAERGEEGEKEEEGKGEKKRGSCTSQKFSKVVTYSVSSKNVVS